MKCSNLIVLAFILLSGSALSEKVPDEFRDLFNESMKRIYITIAGDSSGVEVKAIVSYDTFRLIDNSLSKETLVDFLVDKNIKEAVSIEIVDELLEGIRSESGCKGRVKKCVLETNDRKANYLFDFDNSSLKIFIAPSVLEGENQTKEYVSAVNNHNALINNARLYAYTDIEDSANVSFGNQTTLGLPFGYAYFDTQYNSTNSDFSVYTAYYNLDYKDKRLLIGEDRYNPTINSTDAFYDGADYSGRKVLVGTSPNLLKRKKAQAQKIYFYAPQEAQVEAYRGDRLVYSRSVSEGKHFISYSDLPSGVYDLNILLTVSGETIFNEGRLVNNSQNVNVNIGEFDYSLAFGEFDEVNEESRFYYSAFVNYRFFENLMLGTGVTNSSADNYYQFLTVYQPLEGVKLEYNGGWFDNDDRYHNGRIDVSPFYADFSALIKKDDKLTQNEKLSSILYNENSFQSYGLGVSGDFLSGNGYIRVSQDKREDIYGLKETVNALSGSWGIKLGPGTFNSSVTYNSIKHSHLTEGNDSLILNLNYILELGNNVSSQFAVNSDYNGKLENINTIRYTTSDTVSRFSGSVASVLDDSSNFYGKLSLSGGIKTNEVNADGYLFVDATGAKNMSGTITGTQIVTKDGFDFTRENASSYVKVKVLDNLELDSPVNSDIYSTITMENRVIDKTKLVNEDTVIGVKPYTGFKAQIKNDSKQLYIENNEIDSFSLIGSVYELQPKIAYLDSILVVLDDIEGNPITSVECLSEGCKSIERITSDGVYRVNYIKGSELHLISRKGMCLINVKSESKSHKKGVCLPEILEFGNEYSEQDLEVLHQDGNDNYVFAGLYTDEVVLKNTVLELGYLSLKTKLFSFERGTYLFVELSSELTNDQIERLTKLNESFGAENPKFTLIDKNKKEATSDEV
ncbi:TcfC E-set like domain-containing protein [Vibrio sp. CyArs1]|uniref:TcfC E-set like domain-containing protein n=1 Tax=Vibrio sp. CyArs1 TaxID=2682577 RepID=UPI001F05BC4B|nr:TcfC E-set like domain-containing protein [Vibrio sp. CyArs1]